MSVIAGLVDFRQEAPPADVGIYQFPAEILVFKFDFSGTTYVCAVRSGVRGWVLVDYEVSSAVNDSAVIQSALDGLAAGRDWKEKVIVKGDYTLGATLTVPSYMVLEIQGKLTLADNVNDNVIENSATGGNTQIEIIGGMIDANRANQTTGFIIFFTNVSNSIIADITLKNGYYDAIHFEQASTENVIKNVTIDTVGQYGIVFYNTSRHNKIIGCRITNASANGIRSAVTAAYNDIVGTQISNCGIGIYAGGDHVTISGCEIFDCSDKGIELHYSDHIISGCDVTYCRNVGIHLTSDSYVCTVAGNMIARAGYDETVQTYGVGILAEGTDIVITGNQVNHSYSTASNAGIGIHVTGDRNTITGCTIYEIPVNPTTGNGHGIVIESDNNTVTGNIVYNCNGDGIQINNASNNIIGSNRCTANANYGVNETGTSDYTLIHDNNLTGNTTGSLATVGVNTITPDNIT